MLVGYAMTCTVNHQKDTFALFLYIALQVFFVLCLQVEILLHWFEEFINFCTFFIFYRFYILFRDTECLRQLYGFLIVYFTRW